MKHTLILLILSTLAFANPSDYKSLKTDSEKVQSLWMSYTSNQLDPIQLRLVTKEIATSAVSFTDMIRIRQMHSAYSSNKSTYVITNPFLTQIEAIKIVSDMPNLSQFTFTAQTTELLRSAQKKIDELHNVKVDKESINDLIINTPDYAHFKNGEYKDTIKAFMFCREDRNFSCRIILKDIFNNLVRNDDGSIWSLPTLALSSRGLPYNVTNGSTPTGVHSIDSVMPEANRQKAFGKHRRLILNWIENDKDMYHLLPKTSLKLKWWKQASIARNNGRKWLRIHGTGNMNTDLTSTYYPHVPTSGCISTKEGKYDVEYNDQRVILNKMMEAMQMAPVFTNEVDLKGMLYVVNLDNKKEAVTHKEINKLLN